MPTCFGILKNVVLLVSILSLSLAQDTLLVDGYNDNIIEFNSHYDANASIELLNWSPDTIKFDIETNNDQFLIISEIFYPDSWIISDGINNYNIYEVNNCVRGFFVPSGTNQFIMYFKPEDVEIKDPPAIVNNIKNNDTSIFEE